MGIAEKIYDIYIEIFYMDWWKKLLMVAVIAVLIVAYFLWPKPQPKPELIILSLDVEGRGSVDCSGKLRDTKPFNVTLVAKPEVHWLFKYWILNSSKVIERERIYLEVRGNSTLKAVFEEKPKYRLLVQLRGNGSCTLTNSTWYQGEKLNISCVAAKGWKLSNITLDDEPVKLPYELIMDRDHTLEVFFEKVVEEEVRGRYVLRIVSNVRNAYAVVNGEKVELPYTIALNESKTVTLEGNWSLPYNSTHSWWLGWYNLMGVNEKGETIETIIPYHAMDCIEVLLDGNYTLEIHYVHGLKQLPYVLNWYKRTYEEEGVKMILWYMNKVEYVNYSLVMSNCTNEEDVVTPILLEFDKGISKVLIEVRFTGNVTPKYFDMGYPVYCNYVVPIILDGSFKKEGLNHTLYVLYYDAINYVLVNLVDGNATVWNDKGKDVYLEYALMGWEGWRIPNTGNYAVYLSVGIPTKPGGFDETATIILRVIGVEP